MKTNFNISDFNNKKIIAFDVDGTLTTPKGLIDDEMADLLRKLLAKKQVAIITGEAFCNIEKQILNKLNLSPDLNRNLILLPTNGASLYVFKNVWEQTLFCQLTKTEKEKIIQAIKEVDEQNEELKSNKSYGLEIQDRISEITYSALGEEAPLELKKAWDPDFQKRKSLQKELKARLPDFEVKIGGTTSIDITPPGLDKSYGMSKLLDYSHYQKAEILFVGDAVYDNGNDYPVYLMGIETVKVSDLQETRDLIQKILTN